MNDSNVVDNIVASGAAERADMLLGDRVVGVNGVPLTSAPDCQWQGHRRSASQGGLLVEGAAAGTAQPACYRCTDAGSGGRKRLRPAEQEGMATLDGVRTGNGGQSHIQRLVGQNETRTERSL